LTFEKVAAIINRHAKHLIKWHNANNTRQKLIKNVIILSKKTINSKFHLNFSILKVVIFLNLNFCRDDE